MKKITAVIVILLVSMLSYYFIYSGMKRKESPRAGAGEMAEEIIKAEPEAEPAEGEISVTPEKADTAFEEEPPQKDIKDVAVKHTEKKPEEPARKEDPVPAEEPPIIIEEEAELVEDYEDEAEPVETLALATEEDAVEAVEEHAVDTAEVVPDEEAIETPAFIPVPPPIGTEGETAVLPPDEEEEKPVDEEPVIAEEPPGEEEVSAMDERMEEPVDDREEIQEGLPALVERNSVAIFPFENFTEDMNALNHVSPLLIERLEKKGFSVVDQDSLVDYLCKERVRSTGYVSKELAGKIRTKFKVSTILTGSIISFSEEDNPSFGVMARLIDSSDGEILWADYASATGEDFMTILKLGKVNTVFGLIPRVVDRLFASFTSEDFSGEVESSRRVVVMPFRNNSDFSYAGKIAMYMVIIELLKSREFTPVEYGNVRNLVVSLQIRNKGELSFNNISGLSDALHAGGIVVGVVDNYSQGIGIDSPPEVGMRVRLINGRDNRIIWYNSAQSRGDEKVIALDWGRIRSVHGVAYQAVSKLVKKMEKVAWP
jgi:TolB-like protein